MRSCVVALVGRPNVGKSTLFNRLCRSRDAIVHDRPGLTRDRRYGKVALGPEDSATIIDTGGLGDTSEVGTLVNEQVEIALIESDLTLLMVDARDGLVQADIDIVEDLRRKAIEFHVVVNKIDGLKEQQRLELVEFERFGVGSLLQVSASHGDGIGEIKDLICRQLHDVPQGDEPIGLPVAVIGRPNVGKSTLVNAIVGDERCVVFDQPGTTRDTIKIPFQMNGRAFTVMDTAGIRRRSRVEDSVEKFSVIKALDAIDSAKVAVLVVDANEGLVEQDLHLIRYASESGTGLLLAVNKCDQLDQYAKARCRSNVSRRIRFAEWIPVVYISALNNRGVRRLLPLVERIHESGKFEVTTSSLTESLNRATENHPPANIRGRSIKLKLAQKVTSSPPTIVVHGNQTDRLTGSYIRYLENFFRHQYRLIGLPVVLKFIDGENPFKDQRNRLTRRQSQKRQRVIQKSRRSSR